MSKDEEEKKTLEEIGERVDDLVKGGDGKGTLKEAANKIGISEGSLSEIINGKRPMKTDTLKKICDHYNASADYILGYSNDPRPLNEITTIDKAIEKRTGLSAKTIERISGFYLLTKDRTMLNSLFSDNRIFAALNDLYRAITIYIDIYNRNYKEKIMKEKLEDPEDKDIIHAYHYYEDEHILQKNKISCEYENISVDDIADLYMQRAKNLCCWIFDRIKEKAVEKSTEKLKKRK